ncbi:microsomal signal peptidase [Radiomyces spectabilis]|uniref:microsomal signal peptidase n=1 Tax=Radiomyces spectabilis TaxID=64574 RepID=UPI0022203551|nr:microsomal signal peptidase [Radiomyces spectabilis]KAI8366070.1 microsomal signal peptidase [Radiomyces spectabilis]
MALAELLECTIDFEGQKLADQIAQVLLTVFSIASFVVGFSAQSMLLMLAIFAMGVVVTVAVVLPPWPMFRRHPQPWLKAE